ncbi:glycosyltransferase, group 4 domain protein [Leptospira borgpetersenii serovar Pomona str. 200901868]|uniref:Glycosyltransferase, group 4 domain protein n=1 Tax=Leptospira borgpetersenii serovar Pomona str. 200901868 TaxID=1192866 RepID=M6W550_LEPBO|nr:glycosyltransferase, group 4 domain protein [Leptospira borgpetersenii serovar Pomona str. 200901868]
MGFNLPKAKLFLGDVGSLPLGYSIAVLPLFFIDEYHWARFEITSAFFLLPVFLWTVSSRSYFGLRIGKIFSKHIVDISIN